MGTSKSGQTQKSGVAQVLNTLTFVSSLSHLRRLNAIIKSQIRKIYFEDLELKEKFKDINLTIDNVIKDSYILLSPDIKNIINDYPNYYYINNDINDIIEFKNRFFCFLFYMIFIY